MQRELMKQYKDSQMFSLRLQNDVHDVDVRDQETVRKQWTFKLFTIATYVKLHIDQMMRTRHFRAVTKSQKGKKACVESYLCPHCNKSPLEDCI